MSLSQLYLPVLTRTYSPKIELDVKKFLFQKGVGVSKKEKPFIILHDKLGISDFTVFADISYWKLCCEPINLIKNFINLGVSIEKQAVNHVNTFMLCVIT